MLPDPLLRRLEIGALIWCAAVTVLAWLATGSGSLALGVLGGGALAAVSFLAIKTSVEALIALMPSVAALPAPPAPPGTASAPAVARATARAPATAASSADGRGEAHETGEASETSETSDATPGTAAPRGAAARALAKLVGRYALLGLMAYAMIARLRLHPIGLLIGASSLVASASFEAFRVVTRPRRV